jgi:hypothetical protein
MTATTNLDIEHLVSNASAPEVPVNEAFELIDSCLSGQVTINFASDADLTLSTTGDAPQEWQYLSVELTDTSTYLTTARNVIVPDNNKPYVIYNNTAQILTVKTSAGTGIAVAVSGIAFLYCDGTNVVDAANDIFGYFQGGAVTQITSRTTGVTINNASGAITLVSAAGSTSWQTFTVTNSEVAATDTVIVNQKSGTDLNMIHVTNVAAGSFDITFATTGGTTTEQPVFNFNVIKGANA